ncbi:hypothetical protein HYD83_00850, partial [Mycoplasmopsis bovis]
MKNTTQKEYKEKAGEDKEWFFNRNSKGNINSKVVYCWLCLAQHHHKNYLLWSISEFKQKSS